MASKEKEQEMADFIDEYNRHYEDFRFKPIVSFRFDAAGKPMAVLRQNSINNVSFIIEGSPFADFMKWDDFTNGLVVIGDNGTHEYSKEDYLALNSYVERMFHYFPKENEVRNGAEQYAMQQPHLNAILDYVEGRTWDGQPRVMKLFVDLLGAKDEEYTALVTRMFFGGLMKRIYEHGSKVDEMLVLIGPQGIGKSSIFERLVGGSERGWYQSFKKPEKDPKRAGEALKHIVIGEFGEMSGFTPETIEELKEYLTRRTDSYVPPYGKYQVSQPRHNIFVGTTNKSTFIYDFSGGRRFLPLNVGVKGQSVKQHPMEAPDEFYRQVLSEAVLMYRDGELNIVSDVEETKMLRDHQEQILMADDQSAALGKWFSMEYVPLEWDSKDFNKRIYYEGYPDTMNDYVKSLLMPFNKTHVADVQRIALDNPDFLSKPQRGMTTKMNAIAEEAGWQAKRQIKIKGKNLSGFVRKDTE